MNNRVNIPEKQLKKSIMLLFMFVICGILAACSNPSSSSPSTDNSIQELKVNGMDAEGESTSFTVHVDNNVASVTISFLKPVGAVASSGSPEARLPISIHRNKTARFLMFPSI